VRSTGRAYRRLAAELLGLSWRRMPALTAAAFGVGIVSVAMVAALGLALSAAINAVASGDTSRAILGAVVAAAAYGIIAVLGSLTYNIQVLLVDKVGLLDVQTRVYRDIVALEGMEHLERSDILDRLAITCRAPWRVMEGFWYAIDAGFGLLRLGVALLLLGWISPWLVPLIPLAALPLWFDQLGQRVVTRVETETAEEFRLQQHLFDLLTGAASGKEIRISGAGPELAARQRTAWAHVMRARGAAQRRAAAWRTAGWILFTGGFVGGLAVVLAGGSTPGQLVLAITVAAVMRQSLSTTVVRATDAAATRALVEPYLWLREYIRDQTARPRGTARPPARLRTGIRLDDVGYRYPGTDRPAVDGITADLPAGSVVALVGEYGSGKTTLVKLLSRFYRPDRGRVLVDEVDLADLDTAAWRARCSAAFQDFGRYHARFGETIGLGDIGAIDDRERLADAVRAANADELLGRLPAGLTTQLGPELGGVDLSEGQWQKTALGRASMRPEPLLFLLDEPTASLDAPSERDIFEHHMARARDLGRRTGAVTLVVSHRFSTVAGADLILVLEKGRLVESGTHGDLLRLDGRYAELYGMQADAYAPEPDPVPLLEAEILAALPPAAVPPGRDDDFFDLGVTSPQLLRVVATLRPAHPELTVHDLYRHSTAASLAAHLARTADRRPSDGAR
jgi:ABC-type multidrug transport system fused ATPase/permease subunit